MQVADVALKEIIAMATITKKGSDRIGIVVFGLKEDIPVIVM